MKTCQQPDRHEPGLTCGYPLPCPWHTVTPQPQTGRITLPEHARVTPPVRARLHEIARALKGKP